MRNPLRTRTVLAALATATCLLAVAACGDTKSGTQPQSQTSMPAMSMSPKATKAAPAVASGSITIKEFAFGPATVTVKVGDTVTWTNEDQDPHTVTSQDRNGPLRSATMNTGDSYQYKFTKAGSYAYLCTIHPFMTGTVVVTG
jgi:plastocyanin